MNDPGGNPEQANPPPGEKPCYRRLRAFPYPKPYRKHYWLDPPCRIPRGEIDTALRNMHRVIRRRKAQEDSREVLVLKHLEACKRCWPNIPWEYWTAVRDAYRHATAERGPVKPKPKKTWTAIPGRR